MTKQRIWLVTGVSGGLGRELSKSIYQTGDIIIGTVRKQEDKDSFERDFPHRSRAFIIDLADTWRIPAIVEESLKEFGRIDVLVNNAGYGLFGMVEEANEKELRHQIDVNVIAVWKLTQAVLPVMRAQKGGNIIQISSRVGISAGLGGGLYAAGKFAIEGLSEALAQEVAPFGIKVTLVEPGPLRTDFFGRSIIFAANKIEAYYTENEDIRHKSKQLDGKQAGDPAKVAEAIVEISKLQDPPLRLPFTQATIDTLQQKILTYQQIINSWTEAAIDVQY